MEKQEWDYKPEMKRLEKKYKIPSFEELTTDFEVEKVVDKETSFLIREIRRAIVEKLSAYAQLFETLMNPNSPPMFFFSILKKIPKADKEKIKEMYEKISRIQIKVMLLDTIYNEEAEAEFVNNAFKEWQVMKKEIHDIIERFDSESEGIKDSSHGAGYFG